MANTKTPKRRIFDGTVEVCCHTVKFWYDIGRRKLTDELKERLTEEAESRAKDRINADYHSGDLNCLYNDAEISGWWGIDRT